MSWQATVVEFLSASLLRPFLLAAGAAIVLRLFRVEHPASRHAVWTAVLTGMLILPIISVTVPHLELEALPGGTFSGMNRSVARSGEAMEELEPEKALATTAGEFSSGDDIEDAVDRSSPAQPTADWVEGWSALRQVSRETLLLGGYVLGLFAFSVYRLTGWILLRRLISRSTPCASAVLRESRDVVIPIAAGILRPVVILPSHWREWPTASRRSVLAHEFAHVRRRDAWILALSRTVKCIFWFHPLSWWVARRVSELAEMACDAAALQRVDDPGRYSKILIDFAGVVSSRGYRASLPGLAMVGRSRLSRRIDQVFRFSNGNRRKLPRPGAVMIAIGIPGLCMAATVKLTEAAAQPLRQVQATVVQRIESVAQVAGTEGVLAAIAEVVQPAPVEPEPVQSAESIKVFVDQYCVQCHPDRPLYGPLILENQDLNRVRDNAVVWEKVLLRLRSGLEPKTTSGPMPTREAVRSVVQWLERELDRNAPLYIPAQGPRRLNRTEYANAIRDIMGLDINPALLLPADDSSGGFDTTVLFDPPQDAASRAAAYATAAERITALATNDSAARQAILVCRPFTIEEQEPCARRIITNLAVRAFRRPVSDDELNVLMEGYRNAGKISNVMYFTYDVAIQRTMRNILTDPRFLYRAEAEPPNALAGQTYRISDLELATRLSYFLWSRGPDEQLLEAAGRGQLSNPIVLEQETRRMLKDPRASALTTNFAAQWLQLRNLQSAGPMPSYPDFDESLQQAMRREVELFFASIVQEDRNVLDLLTADYTFLNERLAQHYGISNVSGSDFRRVELGPALDVRRGLLGKAAILTLTSRPDRTSLTTRAKWVLGNIMGVYPPDPPPNVPPMRPKVGPMRATMERELQIGATCVSCHRLIDPVGIALDNFDQAGKWRTEDSGQTINAVTDLIDGTPINGPVDLRNALVARSDQFVQTLTLKLLTYGLGRRPAYQDMPWVRSIVREAAQDNNRFSAIVVGIVKSPGFQMNAKN